MRHPDPHCSYCHFIIVSCRSTQFDMGNPGLDYIIRQRNDDLHWYHVTKVINVGWIVPIGFPLSVHVCAEFGVTLNVPLVTSLVSPQRRYDEDAAPVTVLEPPKWRAEGRSCTRYGTAWPEVKPATAATSPPWPGSCCCRWSLNRNSTVHVCELSWASARCAQITHQWQIH